MSLIAWTKEQFATDVAMHDIEHQKIFQMLNVLHETAAGSDRAAVGRQFDALIVYVVEHFRSEETNMIRADYAGLAAHKTEYDKLVLLCLELQKKFHDGRTEIGAETTALIRDWLVHHIPNIDRGYAAPMRACGIA